MGDSRKNFSRRKFLMTLNLDGYNMYHSSERIAQNKLNIIRSQIDLEKLEIQQNQIEMERLDFHNGKTKNVKSSRFWSIKSRTKEQDFRRKNLNRVQFKKKKTQIIEKFYGLAINGKENKQITTQSSDRF